MDTLPIFVGYDPREDFAYQVCEYSISRNMPHSTVAPLIQIDLRDKGMYWREIDSLASTEFTFTRFLVPELTDYTGWALFCDCDVIFLPGAANLYSHLDNRYAVMCVQHDYNPVNSIKMDGKFQHLYPRKNWSSVVLWNCAHPANRVVNAQMVTQESGAYLHRFSWLDDSLIGNLPVSFNWLTDWYREPTDGEPAILHYTEGGPWFPKYRNCEYSAEWKDLAISMLTGQERLSDSTGE